VAAVIRTVDAGGAARLLPTDLPPGMSAVVRTFPHSYLVTYSDDLHTRMISISVNAGANPPPITGGSGSQTHRTFQGRRALYTVYDTTAPLSQRYLMWPDDKGIASAPPGPQPDYYLGSTGLTESEFLRVADSLQPV
jgi:hypothetical protein